MKNSNEKRLDNIFAFLCELGKFYEKYVLVQPWDSKPWDKSLLQQDWRWGLEFFISRVYYQGRSDELSYIFYERLSTHLEQVFKNKGALKGLIKKEKLPKQDLWWKTNSAQEFITYFGLNNSMGKPRDLEMTVDILRYLSNINTKYYYNIVPFSIDMIRGNKIKELRAELIGIRGVGEKTSAFFLRDLAFLFNLKINPEDYLSLQPVDTWVSQVRRFMDSENLTSLSDAEWFIKMAGKKYNPALLNAGAWYLGKHSFNMVFALLEYCNLEKKHINSVLKIVKQKQEPEVDG